MGLSEVAHSLTESLALSPDQATRLEELLDNYLRALEQGRHPDRHKIIGEHPDLADALNANLTKLDALHRALLGLGDGRIALEDIFLGEFPAAKSLGDFRLIREIGRGGMGVVYEAEQLSLGRHVALKVLPFAAVLDERQLRRFKSEAQAAALLKHPNIVSVYSVGCERGVHYYAMELVAGWSLSEVIEFLRQQSAASDKNGEKFQVANFGSSIADAWRGSPTPSKPGAMASPPLVRRSARVSDPAGTCPEGLPDHRHSANRIAFH